MMGGQENQLDVSHAGFDMDFLGHHLSIAGFLEVLLSFFQTMLLNLEISFEEVIL